MEHDTVVGSSNNIKSNAIITIVTWVIYTLWSIIKSFLYSHYPLFMVLPPVVLITCGQLLFKNKWKIPEISNS